MNTFLRGVEDRPLFTTIPGDFRVSFEFFPPKTEKMEEQLWNAVLELAPLGPSFVSVTYGAGGSTRERTHATVARIAGETSLVPAAHLTCVAASKDEIAEVADRYWEAGVRHVVALRGDPPPETGGRFIPHPQGYAGAAELVADKKTKRSFDPKKAVGPTLARFLEGHGAILRALGDTIAFCPPMIITEAELNELFDRFELALDDTEAWVGKEQLRAA